MKKLKIAVLAGGSSSERAISLITGKAILENLDREKYEAYWVEMTKDNKFELKTKTGKRFLDLQNKDRKFFDCIFIALHGTPGEDGTVQGMLEMLKIPYTGPNTLSSALCMNKVFAAQIYFANGLPHPEFIHLKKEGWKDYKNHVLKDVRLKIGYPAVVKPVDQGSAVGVSIVKNEKELIKAINTTIKKFPWLMVQKFIKGQEATCGVLEKDGQVFALPPTHIIANKGEFYDYKSKYSKGGSTHICPADFSPEINEQLQQLAILSHKALGCSGMSRTDIFVADEQDECGGDCGGECECGGSGHEHAHNKLYIIETNTIPGMTPVSLLPEAAGKMGIEFSEMLDLIIKAGLK